MLGTKIEPYNFREYMMITLWFITLENGEYKSLESGVPKEGGLQKELL